MPDKIKICIIMPNLKCGGSERFISILCNNINTSVFAVELYILDGEDFFYKITNAEVKVFLLKIKNVRNSLFSILKIIKKSKPDILFTASNHLNIFINSFKFLLPPKLKLIARESNTVSVNNKMVKYGKPYNWLVKKVYKNSDYIICQCMYMQADLIKNYNIKKENTTVIYNPAEEIYNSNSLGEFEKKGKYKFFTVGRLALEKGLDRLLNALSLLNIEFIFYIIGDGPEKNNLQQMSKQLGLENKVFFLGKKLNPYENMADADLFLIGSYYEGLPNTLLETGMIGIPVVGYNSPGGIAEIVVDGVNGFLVNDDEAAKPFADNILKAINYKFNRSLIIKETKNKFSVNKIIPQLESFFLKILQTPE